MRGRLPATLRIYGGLAAAATPLIPVLLARRLKRGKEHPSRIGERRGRAVLARPPGALVWVHGASVGEILAILPLVEQICASGLSALVTSGTVTSARVIERRLPARAIHQFVPLDAPRFIASFLDHWQPDLGLLAESDLWPNLILACADRTIPLVLINGKLSEKSFARWRRLPASIAALLSRFELCLAQSAADGQRLTELGAPRVHVTGNLKLDVPAPPVDVHRLEAMRSALGARPVVAAASTHPGEEAVAIDVHRRLREHFAGLLTIVVPRHPERGASIAELATAAGLQTALRSHGGDPEAGTEIYVADTIGELGLFYRLAPIVFMGGSLIRHGGQNPIEAAKLGAAIVHGPHVWNFAEIYAALDGSNAALCVPDTSSLTTAMDAWLANTAARAAVSEAATKTVEELGGAMDRTLGALEPHFMRLRVESR